MKRDNLRLTVDGNEATARIAYQTNEVIAIYPITPSSTMGELADQWASEGKTNLWGNMPLVQEMQSEGGAAGAVHGALQAGAMTTTFTASQGLLLMLPNMFKIAGELTPTVFHIAARSIATHALSIFGDHSDVMAARATGWAMLFANSVQEAHDFALISQAATLRTRIPFLHVFDGFRTSHEVAKIDVIPQETIRALVPESLVSAHRNRGLSPEHPVICGTAQNPDVFFQSREACNPFYEAVPCAVREVMKEFAELTGRHYDLVEYVGSPDAEHVIVLMGSGAETTTETVEALNRAGRKVGLLKVRLYRPFPGEAVVAAIPRTVKRIAVLDRTKEPGANGEPLYKDVVTAFAEASEARPMPFIVGGRYGLSSKEFTPAMVKAVFDNLEPASPKKRFTVGIQDDVSHLSLDFDPQFSTEAEDCTTAIFWGLGADGTVGANKASIKIIGETTSHHAQGYFVYDSKKSGSVTVSHLRFGPRPIRSAYLVQSAGFIAVHQFGLLFRFPVLDRAARGATVLLNAPYPPDRVWDQLPRTVQQQIVDRDLQVYVIDAHAIARENGLKGRINTTMQVAFFKLAQVMPVQDAVAEIKTSIQKSYGKRGAEVVEANCLAVDAALAAIHRLSDGQVVSSERELLQSACNHGDAFVAGVISEMIAGRGDLIPVSMLPQDGTYPVGTSKFEKRQIGLEAPAWDPDLCIQCGKCVLVCPHSAIRSKVVEARELVGAPDGFKNAPAKWKEAKDRLYTLQVSVDDCTGCGLCVDVCPGRDKQKPGSLALQMAPSADQREAASPIWEFFTDLPDSPAFTDAVKYNTVKNVQLLPPMFEFSGACSGCGETPYLRLLSALFGDHAIVANATGCSSIYGANLPTTPWTCDQEGKGPAWANSLFEDNAEFGLGIRLALDTRTERAHRLLDELEDVIPANLIEVIRNRAVERDEIDRKRHVVAYVKSLLQDLHRADAQELLGIADALLETSVWVIGGDGWAYDIGFGGLDHVLASGRNVNVLVLDTEVYSNTGGQASKSTFRGASARFAAAGKTRPKKDLGLMMMGYGNVYVAQVAMGASDAQLLKAMQEAERYDGPSLVIAYGPCIAHGLEMRDGLKHQKLAVDSGYWPLYRFDPQRAEVGENPFQLDSRPPSIPVDNFLKSETRFGHLMKEHDDATERLLVELRADVQTRWDKYARMASAR